MSKLSELRPVEQELELTNPKDGKPLGIVLKVVGPDSKQVRDTERRLHKESITRGGEEVAVEDIEQMLIEKYAASVVGWEEKYNDDMEGPYSPGHILKICSDPDFRWVTDQISVFARDRTNFFR